MRFLCQVPSDVKLSTFPSTTALQRKSVYSSFAPGGAMEDGPAGRCPPIFILRSALREGGSPVTELSGFLSFQFST